MQFDQLKRREFITLLLGAATACPLAALGQQAGKIWRIGFISGASRASVFDNILVGLPQGMRELGYVEGKDFTIEWRYAEGAYERFPEIVAELVRLKVDVFVLGTPAAVRPTQQGTSTIPIVMGYSTDPVGNGFVTSLAHPGGNITGLTGSSDDTAPKQMELLAMVVPNILRVGVLLNPSNPGASPILKSAQAAAQTVRLAVIPAEARTAAELETAFAALGKDRAEAIMVTSDAFFNTHRKRIIELTLRHRLPSIFPQREYAEAGGLMSYGESLKEFFRRAATFVDKIIKGGKPGDLPIEQPTLFKLVLNRKTADALGVTIPPQLYLFADEVIE